MNYDYSPETLEIIELAKNEALRTDNNYVGSEHLLLAIISHYNNRASKVLEKLHLDFEHLREKLLEKARWGRKTLEENFPFSPKAKVAVDTAANLSEFGSKIDSTTLLRGLLKQRNGTATKILEDDFGIDVNMLYGLLSEGKKKEFSTGELKAATTLSEISYNKDLPDTEDRRLKILYYLKSAKELLKEMGSPDLAERTELLLKDVITRINEETEKEDGANLPEEYEDLIRESWQRDKTKTDKHFKGLVRETLLEILREEPDLLNQRNKK